MPQFDTTTFCRDQLVLETIGGAVELLSKRVQDLPQSSVSLLTKNAHTVLIQYEGTIENISKLRLYSVCSVLLAPLQAQTMPSLSEIQRRIDASLTDGLLSAFQLDDSPLRFRISPLRYGRWEIRDFLCEHYKWLNETGAWDINIETCGKHLVAQIGPLYYTKRFPALERIPASTNPLVANTLVTLLNVEPGQTVYDPFCGAGTLLVEVLEIVPKSRVIGSDIYVPAIQRAKQNLAQYRGRWSLKKADATKLPVADESIEKLIGNMPFGKRVGSHQHNQELYPRFAQELARVLAPSGLAALLTEEKQLLRRAVNETKVLTIRGEHVLEIGGLHPSIFLIGKKTKRKE